MFMKMNFKKSYVLGTVKIICNDGNNRFLQIHGRQDPPQTHTLLADHRGDDGLRLRGLRLRGLCVDRLRLFGFLLRPPERSLTSLSDESLSDESLLSLLSDESLLSLLSDESLLLLLVVSLSESESDE